MINRINSKGIPPALPLLSIRESISGLESKPAHCIPDCISRLTQCWFNVGPPSATLAQHQTIIGFPWCDPYNDGVLTPPYHERRISL